VILEDIFTAIPAARG